MKPNERRYEKAELMDPRGFKKDESARLVYDPVRGDTYQELEVRYYGSIEGFEVFSAPGRGIGIAWGEVYSLSLGAGVEVRSDKPNVVYETVTRSQRIGEAVLLEPAIRTDGGETTDIDDVCENATDEEKKAALGAAARAEAELGPFITPGAVVADKETGTELVVLEDSGEPAAEVMVNGKSIMEFESNEGYSVADNAVNVVYKKALDGTVPGWEQWDTVSFRRNLEDFKKEWNVMVREYSFPKGRLGLPSEVDE